MGVSARWEAEKKQWKLIFSCNNLLRINMAKCRLCLKARKQRKMRRKSLIVTSHLLFPEIVIRDFIPWEFLEYFLSKNPNMACEVPIIGAEEIIILTERHEVENHKKIEVFARSGIRGFIRESNKLLEEGYGVILGGFQSLKSVSKQWQHPHIYLIAFPESFLPGGFKVILNRFLGYASNLQEKPYFLIRGENSRQLCLLNLSLIMREERDPREIIEEVLKDLLGEKVIILIRVAQIRNMLGIVTAKPRNINEPWPLQVLSILGIPYECELNNH